MLYLLLAPLADQYQIFNLFRYLTFRAGGAIITALIVAFILGPPLIRYLKKKQKKGQPIREDGPESHLLTKKGTPTMGGLLILLSMVISTVLWADISNGYVLAALLVTIGYGALGFVDDYLKVTKRTTDGMAGRGKIIGQFGLAAIASYWIMSIGHDSFNTSLAMPFLKDFLFDMGLFYIGFAVFVMIGASNAVNLTDGLDGLAIVPVMIASGVFLLIAYFTGHHIYAQYLQLHYVPGTGELAVFLAAIIGAGLGFLWFNAPPAMVFMGDTGSLSLGGALGVVAVATKHEFVLAITGGLFVLETVSVIIQVVSFKLTGKRVFRMAPIHHHFEKMGWQESTIVIRFWIIATILGIIGLSTLKLR
jgi:phospho-N-acetylmuramoyl-pentapeptide-transferase